MSLLRPMGRAISTTQFETRLLQVFHCAMHIVSSTSDMGPGVTSTGAWDRISVGGVCLG